MIFFAGSGISFEAQIPSASEILRITSDVFINVEDTNSFDPTVRELVSQSGIEKNILPKIEPEVLYEKLLLLSRDNQDCLELWKSLSPNLWKIPQMPTLTHLAIVAYSARHRVPILTTNFDLLFELAVEHLKKVLPAQYGELRSEVIMPSGRSYPKLNSKIKRNRIRIVKLHGTIGSQGNELSNILTTMTSISTTRFGLADFLAELTAQYSLSIVGYSGRDIDIFPVLRNLNKPNGKPFYWIDKFSSLPTREGALSLVNCRMIEGIFPEKFFALNYSRVLAELLLLEKQQFLIDRKQSQEMNEVKKNILTALQSSVSKKCNWSDSKKLLLIGILYDSVGMYIEGLLVLNELQRYKEPVGLAREDKCLLLNELCVAAHNNSKFLEMQSCALKLIELAKSDFPYYEILGDIFLAESKRMAIPFDTFLMKDRAAVLFLSEFFTAYDYTLQIKREISRLIKLHHLGWDFSIDTNKSSQRTLATLVQHNLIEFEIRKAALIIAIIKNIWIGYIDPSNKWLLTGMIHELELIEQKSKRLGYAEGIINSYKFLSRLRLDLPTHEKEITEGERLALLLSHSTALQLLQLNRIERVLMSRKRLSNQQVRLYTKQFLDLYYDSIKSGNVMNGIKTLLGLGELNMRGSRITSLEEVFSGNLSELDRLIEGLHLPLWNKYWETIKIDIQKHLNPATN
jgi:hypothetical protein